MSICCFFFFSSRRRHTRCYRDWSSDVCSSDLVARIFSTESIGNGLTAVSEDAALKKGDEGVLPGVTYDASGDFRQTTYLVETSGRPAGMFVRLRDANGRELAHDSFLLEPYEHRVLRIAELARQTFVRNGSLSIRVVGGSG